MFQIVAADYGDVSMGGFIRAGVLPATRDMAVSDTSRLAAARAVLLAVGGWGSKRRLDLLLLVAAVAFGAISLTYPFGRDQGLYHYVGREWALRGSIPYRDVFDHKPPGLYVVHALSVLLFGQKLYAIRVFDLLAIVLAGFFGGSAIAQKRGIDSAPVRGAAAFGASLLFFGFWDFKATSEGEVWITLTTLGALALLQSGPLLPSRGRLVAAGLLLAAGVTFKPTAAILALVVGLDLVVRLWRTPKRLAIALGVVGLAAATLILAVAVWLWARGALEQFRQIVIEGNRLYVQSLSELREGAEQSPTQRLASELSALGHFHRPLTPVAKVVLLLALLRAGISRDWASVRGYVLAVVMCLFAFATVAMQGRFFPGHWTIIVCGTSLVFANLVADLASVARGRARFAMPLFACLLLFLLYRRNDEVAVAYWKLHRDAAAWFRGKANREAYLENFREDFVAGKPIENERVGEWINERSEETDTIAVRGFQPQIYAVARRRYPGRFFWNGFLYGPGGAAHRDEWVAEDHRALAASPPRYAVTYDWIAETDDNSTAWWLARGYIERIRLDPFVIVERTPAAATVNW